MCGPESTSPAGLLGASDPLTADKDNTQSRVTSRFREVGVRSQIKDITKGNAHGHTGFFIGAQSSVKAAIS
jgi:hypothetical protein